MLPESKIKKLTPLENLVLIAPNHMSRYKNLTIHEEIKSKIFGKLKTHTIESYVKAGKETYPEIIESEEIQTKPSI